MTDTLEKEVEQLYGILLKALNRCKYCSGEPFWCDDCFDDKAEFVSGITDLLNRVEPDSPKRLLALLKAVARVGGGGEEVGE